MTWEALAVVIALIAAVISWRSLLSARAANERANRAMEHGNEIQERLLALEEAREADRKGAQERAELAYTIEEGRTKRVVITNQGPGRATDIELDADVVIFTDEFPSVLDAGANAGFPYSITFESPMNPSFRISWRHPSGEADELRGYLY